MLLSSSWKDSDSIQILWSSSKGLNRMSQLSVSTRSLPGQIRLYSTLLYGRYVLKKRHVVYVMVTVIKVRYRYILLHKKIFFIFIEHLSEAENNFNLFLCYCMEVHYTFFKNRCTGTVLEIHIFLKKYTRTVLCVLLHTPFYQSR